MGDCEKAGREKLGREKAGCEEKPAFPENPRLPEEPACEPPCCAKAGRVSARPSAIKPIRDAVFTTRDSPWLVAWR